VNVSPSDHLRPLETPAVRPHAVLWASMTYYGYPDSSNDVPSKRQVTVRFPCPAYQKYLTRCCKQIPPLSSSDAATMEITMPAILCVDIPASSGTGTILAPGPVCRLLMEPALSKGYEEESARHAIALEQQFSTVG